MRFLARFIIGVILGFAVLAAGVYFLHKPIIRTATRSILAGAGLDAPKVELRSVSLSQLTYARITAGAGATPDLSLTDVTLEFDWRELLFKRRAQSVTIGDGVGAVDVGANGEFSIRGFSPSGGAAAGPPLRAVMLDGLRLEIATPKGPATADISGAFDFADGGEFAATFLSDTAGFEAATLSKLNGDVSAKLAASGDVNLAGTIVTDLFSAAGAIRNASMEISGDVRDWRDLIAGDRGSLNGAISVGLRSSTIDAADSEGLAAAVEAQDVKSLSAAGDFILEFSQGEFSVTIGGAPFAIADVNGAGVLSLSQGDGPLFQSSTAGRKISARADVTGGAYQGAAAFDASTPGDGAWAYSIRAGMKDPEIAGFSFGAVDVDARGDFRDGKITGAAEMAALIRKADIGRMRISDLPVSGRVAIAGDFSAGEFAISAIEGECLTAPRASFSLEGQDLDARLGEARLCAADAPFVVVDWSGELIADVIGELSARTGRLRLGKTLMEGAPPKVTFAAGHVHEHHTTIVDGGFEGGAVTLNNALALSRSNGTFHGGLVGEALTFDADFNALRIAQTREIEFVAPVAARGKARLADDVMKFDFDLTTPSGAPLGSGVGAHQVISGRGEATFESEDIVFARGGLQPDKLMPVLLGVVFNTTGVGAGKARFSWSPGVVTSSADVEVVDLSFGGPTVAVTRTEGISGAVSFSNLAPVATTGEQTISIRKVDLDALKLENGEMRFELPGDDTLHVINAEFPWFGGTIGAYDAKAPLSGGKADMRLQIDAVNLSELLSYFKIEGLSGEGIVEGVLPLSIEAGKARINHGVLSASGPGVIRYEGKTTDTAAQSNEQAELAFEVLRELRFTTLTTTIDGALDGELNFKVYFEGTGKIPVRTGKTTQRVDSPVIYRVTIDAPLMRLIDQAITSSDVRLQIKRAKEQEKAAADGVE